MKLNSIWDYEELAMLVCDSEEDSLHDKLEEKFGIDFDTFVKIVEALIPFTIPAKIATLDGSTEYAQGFVDGKAFIVKKTT